MTAPARRRPARNRATGKSTVYLHLGEPKTGTTFLQQVIWRNRSELAAQGVTLPGHHLQDHYRATQDLLGIEKDSKDPAGSWRGEFALLASQAVHAGDRALISHELFSAADRLQAGEAVRQFKGCELHIILTVRDMATLLPAEWQETVKHRSATPYGEWLDGLIDVESISKDRRNFWFWRVHDTAEILRIWSEFVPAERIHVIPTPGPEAPRDELWHRFARVIGVDTVGIDTGRAERNTSLTMPETEFLRRYNHVLSEEVPGWFYLVNVKESLAHRTFGERTGPRLVLPPGRAEWAAQYDRELIAMLEASGYDIVGKLDDLRPALQGEPFVDPSQVVESELLDVAIQAAAAFTLNHYRRTYPAVAPVTERGAPAAGLAERVEARVAASPRLKRAVREASGRSRGVRWLRVAAWNALERSRRRRSSR